MILRGVLFDLDGTLFDRDSAVRSLVCGQHERFADGLGGVAREAYVARVLELDAHGHGDKAAAYQRVTRDFALSEALAEALTADFWNAYHGHCRCFPDVLPALGELQRHGLLLGIITNGAVRIQEPAIARLGLRDFIDTTHISEREGVRKPDPEIFNRALRALGLSEEEAWYVGDHSDVDVRGAVEAGVTGVWRRTSYWAEPSVSHDAIDDLGELVRLIRSVSGLDEPTAPPG